MRLPTFVSVVMRLRNWSVQYRRLGVRGAEMKMRARSSAVGLAGEPALTDQALASASGLQDPDRLVFTRMATCGWIIEGHSRTVTVLSSRAAQFRQERSVAQCGRA